MKNATLALAAGALLALAMTANVDAQNAPDGAPTTAAADDTALPSFDSLDTKHSGQLTRRDIPKDVAGLRDLRAHFIQYDTDHNGRVNAREYAGYERAQIPDSEKKPGED